MSVRTESVGALSTYREFDRVAWSRLRDRTPLPLRADELERWRSMTDVIDLDEVREIYLPLARLLTLHVAATRTLRTAIGEFTTDTPPATPFVVGIAGSVSAGKSTLARVLRALLSRSPAHPHVELVTTDGFLLPNAELERRGLMQRKGFPESYDQRALLRFVAAIKAGSDTVTAPVYSHLSYDIVPEERITVRRPDMLILEGLNLLQPARIGRTQEDTRVPPGSRASRGGALAVSDFLDFSIYLDARVSDLRGWYVERFLALRRTAFADPRSYFHRYADLTDDEARARAEFLWTTINEPNLLRNIRPTRGRARLILQKTADHRIGRIRLRKL